MIDTGRPVAAGLSVPCGHGRLAARLDLAMASSRFAARVGTHIAEKYEVVRLVAEGGMGAVFEARDVQLERRMAVKMLRAESIRDPAAVERFLREARVVA